MSGIITSFVGGSFGPAAGQEAYIAAGTYSWVAPVGVSSVSVVAVGGGKSGTAGISKQFAANKRHSRSSKKLHFR